MSIFTRGRCGNVFLKEQKYRRILKYLLARLIGYAHILSIKQTETAEFYCLT
jgi:hypothetical protein